MMEPQPVEIQVFQALKDWPGLAALVGGNIFAVMAPQKAKLPYLTYFRVSGIPIAHQLGHNSSLVRMQIDVWAKEYGTAKQIALEVCRAMNEATKRGDLINTLEEDQDDFDEAYFRVCLEFRCQQKGGFALCP